MGSLFAGPVASVASVSYRFTCRLPFLHTRHEEKLWSFTFDVSVVTSLNKNTFIERIAQCCKSILGLLAL